MRFTRVRQYFSLIVVLSGLFMAGGFVQSQTGTILSLLNAERQRVGVAPLAVNEQLRQAAQRHSDDMAAGDFLSHTGSDGSEFWQRIAATDYNMTTGAENVLYRWDTDAAGAYDQWRNSPGHYSNMINGAYSEVGIAFTAASSGRYYFTMVLAARPGFTAPQPTNLPPTAIPPTDLPPPSPTFMPTNPPPPSPTLVPANPPTNPPPPTTVPQVPATQMPVPATATFVPPTATTVNGAARVAASPTTLPPSSVPATILPTSTRQSADSAPASVSAVAPAFTQVAALPPVADAPEAEIRRLMFVQWIFDAALQAVFRLQTEIAARPPVISTDLPPESVPEIRLVIDGSSFTIINMSDGPLFLEGLSFTSNSGQIAIERWQSEYLSASLATFPRSGCLQAWTIATASVLDPPADCAVRHAWISVGDANAFWRGVETFTVLHYGEPVTVCAVSFRQCDFNLDGRVAIMDDRGEAVDEAPPPSGVTRTQPTGQADVSLLYSTDSFTIINTSGSVLDLTGLGFSGPGGNLSIVSWQTDALSRSLDAFPNEGCLQAWSLAQSEWQAAPDECGVRHAWIAVNETQTFWMNADVFTVNYNGVVVATCRVGAGRCNFNLSE